MILKILLGLVALLGLVCLVAAFQPSTFRIERSITVAAAPAALFPRLNDLHQVHEWAPWKEKDPNCTYEFTGPAAGVGAAQSWSGNSDVGAGKQTIVESRPNELVRLKLEFLKPFEAVCAATYSLQPAGNQTVVTWTMTGENNFVGKVFCLFMNQDKMVGGEFEKGLAQLKRLAETK
ncbi:MAG: SRPBCC family protein [Candidatus Didemnitutus sp.]|nr:SRPBCC family protein [Candidatus Didemnitutus sp.]